MTHILMRETHRKPLRRVGQVTPEAEIRVMWILQFQIRHAHRYQMLEKARKDSSSDLPKCCFEDTLTLDFRFENCERVHFFKAPTL